MKDWFLGKVHPRALESSTKEVKAFVDGLKAFKTLHPAFKVLGKEDMIVKGLSTPLHDGVKRYYREAGLM